MKLGSGGCCQTTSGIGGNFGVMVSGLCIAAPDWRHGISRAFLAQILCCSLNTFVWIVSVVFSLGPILCFRSFESERRSIGWIGSEVAFLCGVVCFPARLRGWVNSFSLSPGSITAFEDIVVAILIVVVVVMDNRDWFIDPTLFVSGFILSGFRLLFLFFYQLETLILAKSGFFKSGATSARICRRSCLRYVGSQYSLVARQKLPNLLALLLCRGVWQSFGSCHSPSELDVLIF